MFEDGTGEDGLLSDALEGDEGKQKITEKSIRASLKKFDDDASYDDEVAALTTYLAVLKDLAKVKKKRGAAEKALHALIHEKYPVLLEDEVKDLTINAKWLARLEADGKGEVARVSQTLTGRVRALAERYATPLPALEAEVADLQTRVAAHLKAMGMAW